MWGSNSDKNNHLTTDLGYLLCVMCSTRHTEPRGSDILSTLVAWTHMRDNVVLEGRHTCCLHFIEEEVEIQRE